MIRHRAAAMRNHETQGGEVMEQVRGQALHEGGGIRVQIMRAGGMETCIAARADVNHRRQLKFDELFVEG